MEPHSLWLISFAYWDPWCDVRITLLLMMSLLEWSEFHDKIESSHNSHTLLGWTWAPPSLSTSHNIALYLWKVMRLCRQLPPQTHCLPECPVWCFLQVCAGIYLLLDAVHGFTALSIFLCSSCAACLPLNTANHHCQDKQRSSFYCLGVLFPF